MLLLVRVHLCGISPMSHLVVLLVLLVLLLMMRVWVLLLLMLLLLLLLRDVRVLSGITTAVGIDV